jgi:hypothetical protein
MKNEEYHYSVRTDLTWEGSDYNTEQASLKKEKREKDIKIDKERKRTAQTSNHAS